MARIVGQKAAPGSAERRAGRNIKVVKYSTSKQRIYVNNVCEFNTLVAQTNLKDLHVATLSASPADTVIESATAYFGSSRARSTPYTVTPPNTCGETQQRAMARRLAQLNAALGDTTTTAPETVSVQKESDHATKKTFGAVALVLTAALSALLGAVTTRLLLQHEMQTPVAVSQPIAVASLPTAAPAMPTLTPVVPVVSDNTRIKEAVESWRNAWMQRDVAAYLGSYSQQFTPADGNARDAWVSARTKKLSAGAPIDLQIHNLTIERIDAEQYKATFLQDYVSGNYRELGRAKTLLITREGDAWKISKEWLDEPKLAMK